MQTHLTLKSLNSKTGPIPVSTTEEASCSPSCPFKKNGCYPEYGPAALHWREVSAGRRGTDWQSFVDAIGKLPDGQLWRHNVAGDLPHIDGTIDKAKFLALIGANKGKHGFTYTHHDPLRELNYDLIRFANQSGFTVNLSANNLADADRLAELDIGPIAAVLPESQMVNCQTPGGRKVIICPAVTRTNVSCATCKLCSIADRKAIVGFPSHGTGKRKANVIAIRAI